MDFSFIDGEKVTGAEQEIGPIAKRSDPFDIKRAKKSFAEFESVIKESAKEIAAADIKNSLDAKKFTDTIGKGKSLIKDFEKLRKNITGKAYQYYKDVMGFEKYYTAMIDAEIIKPANLKLSIYFKQIEIERQKAEKAAQAAAAKKQIELDKIADDAGVDRVELDQPIIKDDKAKVVGEAASAHAKTNWLYKVVDFNLIPRIYVMVDDKAIKRAIKNGERNIAGIEIYSETEAQVRARR